MMEQLSGVLAFGIWPALPLSGYWLYVHANRPLKRSSLPSLTVFALIISMGITLFSLPMLFAAAARVYKAEYFGLIGWVITILSLWRLSRKREVYSAIKNLRLTGWNLVLMIGLIVSAVLYLGFPTETILGGRDEGVYANHAIYIARHGRIDIPYPYPAEFASLFEEALHSSPDVYKTFMPGFYLTSSNIKVQFGHLFPVWLAQACSTFGHQGLFRLNTLFTLLSLCIFYGLCCSAIPRPYAVAATLFLALNPSQIWLTRITLTEILTQLFIWSGLLLLAQALKNNNKSLARWAGIFIGFSAFVRIDSFFLLPLLILSHLALKVVEEPTTEKTSSIWPAFYPLTLILFVFAAGYYAFFSTPYFIQLSPYILKVGVVSLVFFFVLLMPTQTILKRIHPYIKGRLFLTSIGIVLFALTVYAYWVRPNFEPFSTLNQPGQFGHGTRDYREDSLVNLAQYLSPFVIWAAVTGWLVMVWNTVKQRRYACFTGVLLVTFGFSILYLWNPSIKPGHFLAIRRFVPVVIPGMIFFAAFGIWYVMEKIPKTLSKAVSILILVILTLFTVKSDALIFNFAENRGSFQQIQQLAHHLPQDEIILSDRGVYLPPWETPLYISFDRKIVPVDLNFKSGIYVAKSWFAKVTAENRPFYLLDEEKPLPKGLNGIKLYEIELSWRFAEQPVHPLPKAILKEERTIGLYKINGIISDYKNISLGPEKYFGVMESGFHGQEWKEGRFFRWTDGNAKLIVPLDPEHPPRSLRMEFFSHCPKELKLKVLLNNHELYQGQIAPGKGWSKTFSVADLPLGNQAIIKIMSDRFVPKEVIQGSMDTRTLGVTVQDIRLLDTDQPERSHQFATVSNYKNLSLGSEKRFGVVESGFHDQEWNGGKPFRWTDGNAKLIVPLDPEHPPRSLRVEFFSHCPKELKLKILLNHHELYQGQIAPGKGWSKTFSVADLPLGNQATIEIVSDRFFPKEVIQGSVDTRTLGVTVQDIRLLDTD